MKNVVPNIRFKNFNSEWFKIQINDLLINRQNKNYVSKYFLDAPSISNKKYSLYKNQKFKWAPCDSIIFIKDGSVGELFYTKYDVRIASTCEYMTLNINNLFGYYLFTKEMPSIKSNILTGQVIPHLYKKDIAKLSIYYSQDANEQQKIAKLFSTLDNLIDASSIKLNKFKKIKKSFMNKMFSKNNDLKIQFTKLKNHFIEDKLKEIIFINKKSKIGSIKVKEINKGKYCFFTSGSKVYKYNDYLVDGNNIFMNDGGVADFKFYVGKAHYSDHVISFYTNENKVLVEYMYFYLLNKKNEIEDIFFKGGTGLQNISKNEFFKYLISYPSDINEQKKISKFFLLLDDIIEKIEIKLNKYTKVKQTLMNEMFI